MSPKRLATYDKWSGAAVAAASHHISRERLRKEDAQLLSPVMGLSNGLKLAPVGAFLVRLLLLLHSALPSHPSLFAFAT